jgi:RNA polymerase sigma-70 factor, ECF subfamily
VTATADFERLATPHMAAAYNLAFWLVRNRADAEDIVQDAFLNAYRGFGGFSGDDIRPWLMTIVRNAAYRWLGRRKRAGNVVSIDQAIAERGDGFASDEPSAEARLIGEADRNSVLTALAGLPPVFREALVLREIEGMSYRDIAELTGVPAGTVMSRLARGRAELRKTLNTAMRDQPDAL